MDILVIGSGGREHALCWKIASSPLVNKLYCSPGNAGIAQEASCVELNDNHEIIDFCKQKSIDLVVVGPEAPLVEGLSDILRAEGVKVFGPTARAAQLEGSKAFTKDLCAKYDIPTAEYGHFTDSAAAKAYINHLEAPLVIKADGLAAGKGVVIASSKQEAEKAVEEMFAGKFGSAGSSVIIEEFLQGEELSFFAFCDGRKALAFGTAQDHKRAYDGDEGPNTGGMGTYSPPPVSSAALQQEVMEKIINPTIAAMEKEGYPYHGILFAGLMLTASGPKLLEYNVRFGDPETQSLLMRLKSDIVPALVACAEGSLENISFEFHDAAALCVVLAARGYPGNYEKGSEIRGLEAVAARDGVKVFHAGTIEKDGKLLANGGRVLGVTALGDTLEAARENAYAAVDAIDWPQGFCRRDIGLRAAKRQAA